MAQRGLRELLAQNVYPNSTWGTRMDGSAKGMGWLGPMRMTNGGIATEISIGGDPKHPEEPEMPLLVPTLTPSEVMYMRQGNAPTRQIIDKAKQHGLRLLQHGLSPFVD